MTYFLIAGVVAIWGIVFYRIFTSVAQDEGTQVISFKKTAAVAAHELKDTFRLIASYRDPFLGTMASAVGEPIKAKASVARPKTAEIQIDWSFIAYNGSVYNKQAKKSIALLTIKGQDVMMSEKETVGDVTLAKNFGDSIQVIYQKKKNMVKLMKN